MGFLNKLAGMFLGGFQGVFIGFAIPWILEFKPFLLSELFEAYSNFRESWVRGYIEIKMAFTQGFGFGMRTLRAVGFDAFVAVANYTIYLLCIIPASFLNFLVKSLVGVPLGFALGAVYGFSGGVVSSSEKQAPARHLFSFFKALCALYEQYFSSFIMKIIEMPDLSANSGEKKRAVRSYLSRKYLGFGNEAEAEPQNAPKLLRDLQDDPRYATVLTAVLGDLSGIDKFRYTHEAEFKPIKGHFILRDCVNIVKSDLGCQETKAKNAKALLVLLVDNEWIRTEDLPQEQAVIDSINAATIATQANRSMMVLRVLKERAQGLGKEEKQEPQAVLNSFFRNPLFDKNLLSLIASFVIPNCSNLFRKKVSRVPHTLELKQVVLEVKSENPVEDRDFEIEGAACAMVEHSQFSYLT